jgi:hypothetical protein
VGLVSLAAGLFFARVVSRAAEETTFDPRLGHTSELREIDASEFPAIGPASGQLTGKFPDRTSRPADVRTHDRTKVRELSARLERMAEEARLDSHLEN